MIQCLQNLLESEKLSHHHQLKGILGGKIMTHYIAAQDSRRLSPTRVAIQPLHTPWISLPMVRMYNFKAKKIIEYRVSM